MKHYSVFTENVYHAHAIHAVYNTVIYKCTFIVVLVVLDLIHSTYCMYNYHLFSRDYIGSRVGSEVQSAYKHCINKHPSIFMLNVCSVYVQRTLHSCFFLMYRLSYGQWNHCCYGISNSNLDIDHERRF